jgi:hypothetical protein
MNNVIKLIGILKKDLSTYRQGIANNITFTDLSSEQILLNKGTIVGLTKISAFIDFIEKWAKENMESDTFPESFMRITTKQTDDNNVVHTIDVDTGLVTVSGATI